MANGRFGLRTRPGLIGEYSTYVTRYLEETKDYIDASGITNPVLIDATDTLFRELLDNGTWGQCYAIYLLTGGSANAVKFNAKNPLDTDAAFRLEFSGGITYASSGATFNGTTGYADTNFNVSTGVTDWDINHHMGIYLRTQQPSVGDGWHIGVGDTSNGNPIYGMAIRRFSNNANQRLYDYGNVASNSARVSDTTTDARGFYCASSRAANNRVLYRNGTSALSDTVSKTATAPNGSIHIGAINNTAGSKFYLQGEMSAVTIGSGLTSAAQSALYTAINNYMTTLGINV